MYVCIRVNAMEWKISENTSISAVIMAIWQLPWHFSLSPSPLSLSAFYQ